MTTIPTGVWPIDPTATSGSELAAYLNDWVDAFLSQSANATRPATIQRGGVWAKTLGASDIALMLYDGTTDHEIGKVIGGKASFGGGTNAGTTAPTSPAVGDLWYDTANAVLMVYDGANWNPTQSTVDAVDVTYTPAGTGAKKTNVQAKLRESVSVKDFGAVGDGVTDDTAAIQAAIDYCLTQNLDSSGRPTNNLAIVGRCRITSSLVINRLVDSAAADRYFTIYGIEGGGFYTDTTNCVMFTSTLPYTAGAAPVCQMVRFQDLYFESSNSVKATTFVLDKNKFLRTVFQGCNFLKTRCLSSTASGAYTQSIYFFQCDMRRVPGIFYESPIVTYDLKVIGCLMEATDNGWKILSSGCAFVGNCMEGMAAGYTIQAEGNGLTVSGNYFEGSTIDLDFSLGANLSFSVTGNFFGGTTGGGWAVKWGSSVVGCSSTGNYAVGKLHQFTAASSLSLNDYSTSGELCSSTNTMRVYGNVLQEDPEGYGNSRVFENLNRRKFTGQLTKNVSANTNFLQIDRSADDATIIIDLVAEGIQPGINVISQMNRWVVTEDGGGATITAVDAINKGIAPITATVSGNNIILAWTHAGVGNNFFQVAYEILGIAGANAQNSITVTSLI